VKKKMRLGRVKKKMRLTGGTCRNSIELVAKHPYLSLEFGVESAPPGVLEWSSSTWSWSHAKQALTASN
jgi:hypothetical protein